MRVAVDSLNRYLEKPLSVNAMVQALERTEIEVEEVIGSGDWDERIVVGEVKQLRPHPNADRLKVAVVSVGRQRLQIVCGAPNIARGQKVAVALAGATLPDGTPIIAKPLRGVDSQGMICSARELGISDDHSGILVLDHSTPNGKKLCDVWQSSPVLDVKTQASRWDHNSWVGIAREIAVFGLKPNSLKLPDIPENHYEKTNRENVKQTGQCGRFISVRLKVKNDGNAPRWIVDNLERNGLRSINPVVDITNFVMLELGQPAHAYDAKKLHGNLGVAFGSPAAKLTTLDGVERQLSDKDLVITDERGPVGLAGVMGGRSTEVSAKTQAIVLEVAQFDKTAVRRTALRHGLRTEASARFERGLPLPLPLLAANRLIALLGEFCHAELLDSPTDQLNAWPWVAHIGLRLRRTEQLLGLKLDEAEVVRGLQKLGLEVEHFSLSREAEHYLGTPYKFAANFKQDGISAFDCSYLTDYIYSRIGVWIGHTAKQQYDNGTAVNEAHLKPGDLLFYSGHWQRLKPAERGDIGHVGMYVGRNKVLESIEWKYNPQTKRYTKIDQPGVRLTPLSDYLNNPSYKGARRYVESFNHILAITVPWWRPDLRTEADISEEIMKLIGYDTLPSRLPQLPPARDAADNFLLQLMDLKQQLVATGLFEIMSYSFVSEAQLTRVGLQPDQHLAVANPLSLEQRYLRSSLLPSFLAVLDQNGRYSGDFGWFETAKVFTKPAAGTFPEQPWRLGVVMVGEQALERLRGLIDWLGSRAGLNLELAAAPKPAPFLAGRAGSIKLGRHELGRFGQLPPALLSKEYQKRAVALAELALEPLVPPAAHHTAPAALPAQLVERDVSLQLAESTPWAHVAEALATQKSLYRFRWLEQYRGANLPAGQKTLTIRLEFDLGPQPTTAQIEHHLSAVTTALQRQLRATIR